VEFQYHVLSVGTGPDVLHLDLQPVGTTDPALQVNFSHIQLTDPATGTFAAGGYLAGSATYVLSITAQQQTDIVIDNLGIYRQDVITGTTTPLSWSNLENLPFPRLGKYQASSYHGYAAAAPAGSPYSYQAIAATMPFFDLQFGVPLPVQTQLSQEVRTAHQLNPNAVILPYRLAEEQETSAANLGDFSNGNINVDYLFLQSAQSSWYLHTSGGAPVFETALPTVGLINSAPSAAPGPGAPGAGTTYIPSMLGWLNTEVLPSGEWDGVFFNNLWGSINTFIPNYLNPQLMDVSINNDGTRSTPAAVSDLTNSGSTSILRLFRQTNVDQQLVLGNIGAPSLDPYVNGFLFECVNHRWNPGGTTNFSPVAWRTAFDSYQEYQAAMRRPRINSLEGCGPIAASGGIAGAPYPLPTPDDINSHRFTMGTALLGNGFYGFDLHGGQSPPLWYDEYSVNPAGVAVQDLTKKGYLGQALTGPTELAGPPTPVMQDAFEGTTLSTVWLQPTPAVISRDPNQVIGGIGSLILQNPDHTQPGGVAVNTDPSKVQLLPGNTYLLTFDWRILQTVDNLVGASISINPAQPLDVYIAPGHVAGEHGTAHIPFTIAVAGPWSVEIFLLNGGVVAIDNVTITQGNVGPWRRDFENGVVLVNPFNQPHTFSTTDLSGTLNRTGLHRIAGTQAPLVNNGLPVTGNLTLAPFDAIILLADHISAPLVPQIPPLAPPAIAPGGVISSSSFGAFPVISPGSWVEIYGTNFSVNNDTWLSAPFNGGIAPTSLDGVSVIIGGRPAYISYVSPGQINALVASDAAIGPMQVVVDSPTGESAPYPITIQPTQPGLLATPFFLVNGIQYAVAQFADGSAFVLPAGVLPGVTSRPARPGETITLYGVGFGPVSPNFLAGKLVTGPSSLVNGLQIRFGNTPAATTYAGLAPGSTGLYQFNVIVPDVPDSPAVPLTFTLEGVSGTQTLFLAVQH
jgi:uncharacterized protein (TIGR03437 family)